MAPNPADGSVRFNGRPVNAPNGPQVFLNRVAEGDFSPPAPTDPCVQTLPHTAPRNFGSLRVPVIAIRYRCVDRLIGSLRIRSVS